MWMTSKISVRRAFSFFIIWFSCWAPALPPIIKSTGFLPLKPVSRFAFEILPFRISGRIGFPITSIFEECFWSSSSASL